VDGLSALLEPGDEVIVSDPHYACYPNFIKFCGGTLACVDVAEEDGFQFRPEAVRARIGSRTKALLINSPANPPAPFSRPIAWRAGRDGRWSCPTRSTTA